MFWLGWRRQRKKKRKSRLCRAVPLSAAQRQWEQTRNFLYYDGGEMPPVYTYKEGTDEQE